jgi:hypothetical protein
MLALEAERVDPPERVVDVPVAVRRRPKAERVLRDIARRVDVVVAVDVVVEPGFRVVVLAGNRSVQVSVCPARRPDRPTQIVLTPRQAVLPSSWVAARWVPGSQSHLDDRIAVCQA